MSIIISSSTLNVINHGLMEAIFIENTGLFLVKIMRFGPANLMRFDVDWGIKFGGLEL